MQKAISWSSTAGSREIAGQCSGDFRRRLIKLLMQGGERVSKAALSLSLPLSLFLSLARALSLVLSTARSFSLSFSPTLSLSLSRLIKQRMQRGDTIAMYGSRVEVLIRRWLSKFHC